MLTRAITGSIFVLVIVASIYFNENITFSVFALIVLIASDEFYGLTKNSKEIKPLRFWGIITSLTIFIFLGLFIQQKINFNLLTIPVAMLFITFFIELFRKKASPFTNISFTLLTIFYIVIPFAMLFRMGYYHDGFSNTYNYQIILGFFLLLWTNDTGAYLSGKFLGKHKLFERISPKKTWEGSIGALILSTAIAFIISIYFTTLNSVNWIIIAIIIAVFGGLGDLVESMLKRSLKIKDSGNILPGHGGILDRFDGLLLAAPFVYFYLILIK